jgi:Protein of unknown function (DUF3131)
MIQDFRPPSGKIILFTHVSGVVSAFVLVAGLQWMAVRANTAPNTVSESPAPIAASTTAMAAAIAAPIPAAPIPAAPIPTPANQTAANQTAARQAWEYFAQNWQASGFVNTAAGETSSTLDDVATTLVALTSARELAIITPNEFDQKLTTLLNTLEESAGSVPPRLSRSLKLVANRYPQHAAQINRIQESWPISEQNTSDADLFAGLESGFPALSPTAVDRLLAAEITQHQATAPLTANTNGLILSSLLYQKVQQPLLAWAGGKAP